MKKYWIGASGLYFLSSCALALTIIFTMAVGANMQVISNYDFGRVTVGDSKTIPLFVVETPGTNLTVNLTMVRVGGSGDASFVIKAPAGSAQEWVNGKTILFDTKYMIPIDIVGNYTLTATAQSGSKSLETPFNVSVLVETPSTINITSRFKY